MTSPPQRSQKRSDPERDASVPSLDREWLVTNGLGGYGAGTLAGEVTWRYHGLLIAALPAPAGRTLMLNHLAERVRFPDGRSIVLGGGEFFRHRQPGTDRHLREFRLEQHLPVWRYESDGVRIEKRILMPYLQNTVHISFLMESDTPGATLELRPSIHFRPFEGSVADVDRHDYEFRAVGHRFEIEARRQDYPPLRLTIQGADFHYIHEGGAVRELVYRRDVERGYDGRGSLWTPGSFCCALEPGKTVTLVASTEAWHTIGALDPANALAVEKERRTRLTHIANPGAQSGFASRLVLAAENFIVSPAGRVRDAARARAKGDELRSVIAGYHWFTDWGRDTMISLEGLALVTGRHHEAGWILRTFAGYVRDGLVPNMFPEGQNEGVYHTADASLWFFHATSRYIAITGDNSILEALLPVLRDIVEHHRKGTRFGIGVDSADGLLTQGAEGYQLTWMDAKVGDWVVTPRRGKAVEINALWYNALRHFSGWVRSAGDSAEADRAEAEASHVLSSFNRRFWNPDTNCLFDVVDGPDGASDPAIRPNQVFAIALPHPVLARERWKPVMDIVESDLLTPAGLRSLNRGHPDYKPRYDGDVRSRDAAYHQGTVWAWLIGPFIDAWLRLNPGRENDARRFLKGFESHFDERCVGTISEIFDAEPPFTPRGCVAQAWSVAEVLRCLARTAPDSQRPAEDR